MVGRHLGAALVEIIGEGADHGRDRQKERKFRRRTLVGPEQHRRHDAGAGTRHAGNHRQTLRDADPQIRQQRKFRGVVFVRVVIDPVDPQQDRPADDQGEADHPGIEQDFLDVFADDQPDDDRGQERYQKTDDEAPVVGIGEHAERDPPQFCEIDHDNGEDRAELNQHRKALPETALAEIEEAFRQQQMPGRGNGQEFRDTLDDAENHRPQGIRHHDPVRYDR